MFYFIYLFFFSNRIPRTNELLRWEKFFIWSAKRKNARRPLDNSLWRHAEGHVSDDVTLMT